MSTWGEQHSPPQEEDRNTLTMSAVLGGPPKPAQRSGSRRSRHSQEPELVSSTSITVGPAREDGRAKGDHRAQAPSQAAAGLPLS